MCGLPAVWTPTRYGVMTDRYCWRSRLKTGVLNGYSTALIEEGRETRIPRIRIPIVQCPGSLCLLTVERIEPFDFWETCEVGIGAVNGCIESQRGCGYLCIANEVGGCASCGE